LEENEPTDMHGHCLQVALVRRNAVERSAAGVGGQHAPAVPACPNERGLETAVAPHSAELLSVARKTVISRYTGLMKNV